MPCERFPLAVVGTAILILLCRPGRLRGQEERSNRPPSKAQVEIKTLFEGKRQVGEHERFLRLTSRPYSLDPLKKAEPGDPVEGWLLELCRVSTTDPSAIEKAAGVIWRDWWPDSFVRPKAIPRTADVCSGPSSGELFIVISFLERFAVFRANIEGKARHIAQRPEEASFEKTQGFLSVGPPFRDEIQKHTRGLFKIDTIEIKSVDKALIVTCNKRSKWPAHAPLVRFTYDLAKKEWTWLKDEERTDRVIPEPSRLWNKDDSWKIQVTHFAASVAADGKAAKRDATSAGLSYTLNMLIPNERELGRVSCWRVFFIPGQKTPQHLAQQRWITVEKKSGWVRQAERHDGKAVVQIALEETADASFFLEPPEGYPLELFPLSGPWRTRIEHDEGTLTIWREVTDNQIVLEAIMEKDGEEEYKIIQKWIKGEKWWREYERYVRGRKDLYARLIPSPTKKATESSQKSEVPPNYDLSLRKDLRLRPTLTVQEKNPDLTAVLARLEKATGLSLNLDDKLAEHRPQLGHVQLRDAPAWSVMEWVSQMQVEDGRWEKTTDGYRLIGQSTAPRPVSSRLGFFQAFVTPAVLITSGLLFLAVASVALFRRSAAKVPAPPRA
jgi:hypothetical protein